MKYYFTCYIVCLSLFLFSDVVVAQTYPDHFGTGNDVGISVSSSEDANEEEGSSTLDGTGGFPDMIGASRFLAQASLGANYEEIEYLTEIGIEAWLDEQINMEY